MMMAPLVLKSQLIQTFLNVVQAIGHTTNIEMLITGASPTRKII
jgi:hypothetical protein